MGGQPTFSIGGVALGWRLAILVALVVGACSTGTGDVTTAGLTTAAPTSVTTTPTTVVTTTTMATTAGVTGAVGQESGRLLVVGDYGNAGGDEYAVAGAMERYAAEHPVAALLTTGDNLYTNDVDGAWRRPYGWLADTGVPVWVVWGNHDHQRSAVVRETYGEAPYWSVHFWGDVTVILLDSERLRSGDQDVWMDRVLASARGPVIVAEHRPAWSCSTHGDDPRVQGRWVPRWEAAGVDLVLSGHDHNYQRFTVGGVDYVVSGGGGAGLYRLESCPADHPPRLAGAAAFHFLTLTRTDGGIRVEAVGVDGAVIDRFGVPAG